MKPSFLIGGAEKSARDAIGALAAAADLDVGAINGMVSDFENSVDADKNADFADALSYNLEKSGGKHDDAVWKVALTNSATIVDALKETAAARLDYDRQSAKLNAMPDDSWDREERLNMLCLHNGACPQEFMLGLLAEHGLATGDGVAGISSLPGRMQVPPTRGRLARHHAV